MMFRTILSNSINTSHGQFEKIQYNLLSLFRKGEKVIGEYVYTRKELDRIQNEYDNYLGRNAGEEITDDSAANVARERRLTRRLWFTVVFEAILSLVSIKFFFTEMLEFHLQWLPAVTLGVFLAFIILELVLEMRIDDNGDEEDDNNDERGRNLTNIIKKWSYIIPLVFIPALNIFIIATTPGNPLNILYAFFAFFSILLNFKTASYWRQYRILKHSKIAKSRIKAYKKEIKSKERILYVLTFKKMPPLNDKIIALSMKLRSIYESFKEKEKTNFILPIKYLFVMNNLIFHSDVFPIPRLSLTSPPEGDMRIALDAWNNSIFHQPTMPKRSLPEGNNIYNPPQDQNNTRETASSFGNIDNDTSHNSLNDQEYEESSTIKNDHNENTESSDSGSETLPGIPDNEKYV